MPRSLVNVLAIVACLAAGAAIAAKNWHGRAGLHLLNVSYDPTRELYRDINPAFIAYYRKLAGAEAEIDQSHAGSSYQARQVASGAQEADVVTLGLPSDVEGLRKRGLLGEDWRERLPNAARPYYSTIVFVVRKGNPRQIRDWPDLVRDGVEIITPDPKTSGNGKMAALAAWGAVTTRGGDDKQARAFLKGLFDHALFMPAAAREAGVAFAVEKKGDVQLAWENEALREADESKGAVEIVYPPVSLRAEPSVAWVDANVEKHGSEKLARAYLEFLFSDTAQELIANRGYRPANEQSLARHADRLKPLALFPITMMAADWFDAQQKFFGENGVVDTIYQAKPRGE
jgi:sulfate transport system substrate-binding protein